MFNYFKDNAKLRERNQALEAENERLVDERRTLKKELADLQIEKEKQVEKLKLDRKTAEEDIKHMTRIKEEKDAVAFEKKVAVVEREKDKAVASVKDEYRDKLEKMLEKQADDMKKLVTDLSSRFKFNGNV